MFLFLALCVLSKSEDIKIDFSQSEYDLFLHSTGVSVRELQEGSDKKAVYESTNVSGLTVYLSIDIKFTSDNNVLDIYVDLFKLNLDLEIACSNDEKINAGIRIHDIGSSETDYYNYYNITIHSDTVFYFDTEFWDYGMIETYSLSKQLTGRLSPLYLFYDSHSYICYKNTDCLNSYNIGPYDSYFIAKDDESYNSIISNVPLNEDNSFYILLNKNSDFPQLNGILETPAEPTTDVSDITFHLIGISENPVKLSINENIESDKNVVFSNVQLEKATNDETTLQFKTITIDNGTKNVFPTTGCQINCDYFYEYITDSELSQSASIDGKRCFYISPDFEANGDVFLYVSSEKVEIKDSKEVTFATIPRSSNTEIYIENQKNLNHNKIVIINGFGELQEVITEDSLSINFENCGQIPIEFRNWNDVKLSEFKFLINNDMNEIYEEIITNLNSPFLAYDVIKGENTFNFPVNVQKAVICLSTETCSESELVGNHVYQYPINGENIDDLLSSFIEKYTKVESLTLVLNDELKDKTLNLPAKVFKSISFIYKNENNDPLPITLSSISEESINHMEIRKCKITTGSTVNVNQLFVSKDGEITGSNVKFNTKIFEEIIDISSSDQTIKLSDSPLKLLVKSGNSPHKLIFKTNEKSTCTIYIQSCDGSYINIPISFSEEEQSTENPSTLEIITLNHERIIFESIPTNIETTVKFNDIIQYHIPAKSDECEQDKVSICYNNNNCNYENSNDEMYFSSINENDFTAIVNLLTHDQNKNYQCIRLLFSPEVSVYENVYFNQIPSKQVKQLRLTATSPDPEGVYLVLNSDIETGNLKNLLLDPFVFFWRGNENNFIYFDDVSNDFSSVTDDLIDFEDRIIEITDNLYNNYYIEKFHIQSEFASIYYYLSNSNLVGNFGKLIFEIPNDNCLIQYNKNIILGEFVENQEGNIISSPKHEDLSKIYLQVQENAEENQEITIKLIDDTIDQTNLIISKTTGSVTIDFTCESATENKNFELNLYTMNNNTNIKINNNACKEIKSYIIPNVNEDINDVPPTSDYNQSSVSSTFELINSGYKSNEKGQLSTSELDKSQLNRILFTQDFITISEEEEGFDSEIPLYFFSNGEKSRILIKENVKKSNIGVSSLNSPRVLLEKNENPLSFLNEENEGSIELKLQKEETESFIFNEMNNLLGQFYLRVSSGIKNVSFADIKMSQNSSFEIRSSSSSVPLQSDEEEEEIIIHARNSVNISPKSESTINNLHLDGTINMYDDSLLNLSGTSTYFSDKSKININVQTTKETNLLIDCKNALNTIPSSINVLLNVNDKKINIDDLKIIRSLSSLDLCNDLGKKTTVEGAKDLKVSPKCTETDGMSILSLSIKTKKKLSAGVIAGIVIACVVVLAIIIGLIAYFVIRKKNTKIVSEEQNEDDDYSRGL